MAQVWVVLDFVRLLLLHPVANRFLMDEDKERSAPKTSPLDKVFGATISVHMRIRGIIKGISVCSAFIPSYHRSRSHQDNGGPSCLRAILGFVFQGNVRTPVADRRALKVTPPPSLTAHLHSLTHLLIISSALSHAPHALIISPVTSLYRSRPICFSTKLCGCTWARYGCQMLA